MLEKHSEKKVWTIVIFSFLILSGMTMQMRGPLVRTFEDVFSVSESLLGLIAPAGSISFVFTVLLIGFSAGKIKFKKFLALGSGFAALFTFLVGTSPIYLFILLFLVGRGMSVGMFRALGRPVLSHIYAGQRGRIFNLSALAWAVGATLGPIFVTIILVFGTWRLAYFIPAFGFAALFFVVLNLDVPKSSENEKSISGKGIKKLFRDPFILGLIFMIILNGGVEGSFFTWLPYYAEEFFSGPIANLSLSVYLASYLPGRYVYSRLSKRTNYLDLVIFNSSLSVLTLIFAFVLTEGYLMLVFALITGFLVSGIFPTTLAWGTDMYSGYSGPINALTMSSSFLGLSLFPALMGWIAGHYSINKAMITPVILMIGVVCIAVFLRNREGN